MSALASRIARLERELAAARVELSREAEHLLDAIHNDPAEIMPRAGMQPDPWQAALLRSDDKRTLLLASRQAGKTQASSCLAIREAITKPGALILVLSPTQRQSGELFRAKLMPTYRALGCPIPIRSETALSLELTNGSRVVSLPENEEGIRGFSGVTLLIIDEASRVNDAVYRAVRPMVAVSGGSIICLSTPFGKRGFFFEAWEGTNPWSRIKVTADLCPRITAEFLMEEYKALGERWYQQEYLCSFEDAIDSVFAFSDIQAMIDPSIRPIWEEDVEDD
jgi:hypothetical protein